MNDEEWGNSAKRSRPMTDERRAQVRYVVTMMMAVALTSIPAALALGLAFRVFLLASGT